jgi:hypothetical protein
LSLLSDELNITIESKTANIDPAQNAVRAVRCTDKNWFQPRPPLRVGMDGCDSARSKLLPSRRPSPSNLCPNLNFDIEQIADALFVRGRFIT